MLPDRPAFHTVRIMCYVIILIISAITSIRFRRACGQYRAFGFDKAKSAKKVLKHGKNLRNKVLKALESLPETAREKTTLLHWENDIDGSSGYPETLDYVRRRYAESAAFREEVSAATSQVVGRESNPRPIDARLGAECLLQELAFLENVSDILRQKRHDTGQTGGAPASKDSENVVFIYHKPWPVFAFFAREISKHVTGTLTMRVVQVGPPWDGQKTPLSP